MTTPPVKYAIVTGPWYHKKKKLLKKIWTDEGYIWEGHWQRGEFLWVNEPNIIRALYGRKDDETKYVIFRLTGEDPFLANLQNGLSIEDAQYTGDLAKEHQKMLGIEPLTEALAEIDSRHRIRIKTMMDAGAPEGFIRIAEEEWAAEKLAVQEN